MCHFASDSNDPDLPAMGQRFRMKANYPIGGFPRQARVVLAALKRLPQLYKADSAVRAALKMAQVRDRMGIGLG